MDKSRFWLRNKDQEETIPKTFLRNKLFVLTYNQF